MQSAPSLKGEPIVLFGGAIQKCNSIPEDTHGIFLYDETHPVAVRYQTVGMPRSTQRLDRVLPGSGTYALGAPRQLQIGLRITF
jgi:hypothetical protein